MAKHVRSHLEVLILLAYDIVVLWSNLSFAIFCY